LLNDVKTMGGGGTPTVDGKGLGERRGGAWCSNARKQASARPER